MKKFFLLLAIALFSIPSQSITLVSGTVYSVNSYCESSLNGYRWDGQNSRLSKSGKKKLDKLRKQIKDNKEIKKLMTNMDFEYLCSKVTAMSGNPCDGRAGDTKKSYVEASKVCNLPNYCPNVPGL